jgi:hypothetical protein
VALERNGFVFNKIEKGYLSVGAGDEHIGVELIDINDISVLIGVEF